MRVATVLTVYGIETFIVDPFLVIQTLLQQYLPFTVLKRKPNLIILISPLVATVLTVYGIETGVPSLWLFFLFLVATVLTVYGIETSYGELD